MHRATRTVRRRDGRFVKKQLRAETGARIVRGLRPVAFFAPPHFSMKTHSFSMLRPAPRSTGRDTDARALARPGNGLRGAMQGKRYT
jgi:hypothetical protein